MNLFKDIARVVATHLLTFANTPDTPAESAAPVAPAAEFARYTVISDVAHEVAYRPSDGTLEIVYHSGATWHYANVPFEHFETMLDGRSVGGYINVVIKPRFTKATKVAG